MYCTFEDIAEMSGATPQDFKFLGKPMSLEQFTNMVNKLIDTATDEINRYCNVTTFEEREVTDELHSISLFDRFPYTFSYTSPMYRGMFDSEEDYSITSREVFPREYPVQEVKSVKVSYQVNTHGNRWIELKERKTGQNGDYIVIKKFEHCHILITQNLPRYSNNNCMVTYIAGYPKKHSVWSQLRMACTMMVMNMLNYKKTSQEAYTIRGSSVQDYAPMFTNDYGSTFLTRDVCIILDKYRRPYVNPEAYT